LLCFRANRNEHGTLVAKQGSTLRILSLRPPGPTRSASDAGRVGHWAWAALSPNGETFLAQWSAECEVPISFFVRPGARPTPVTGEQDWAKTPESHAYGWTTDGRAIVQLPHGVCGGSARKAGVYLISPAGAQTRVAPVTSRLSRSLAPRRASDIRVLAMHSRLNR
jgi:hypothetical protein